RGAWKILRAGPALGDRDIARCLHERLELAVRHHGLVHPEAVDVDAVDGSRVGRRLHADVIHPWGIGRAHRELATWNPGHAVRRRDRRWPLILHRGLEARRRTG